MLGNGTPSKSFSVEAQFLGLKDGKIKLNKMNGVKIAVLVAKMLVEDPGYVKKATQTCNVVSRTWAFKPSCKSQSLQSLPHVISNRPTIDTCSAF